MKLVAHSTIPATSLPYMHLGYIAALPMNYGGPPFAMALIFIAIAAYVWKKSIPVAIALLVFAVLSFGVAKSRFHEGKEKMAQRVTDIHARANLSWIAALAATDKEIPSGIEQLRKMPNNKIKTDGWKRPFRFSQSPKDDGVAYYIFTSAGSDGKFDTDDDINTGQAIELPPTKDDAQSTDKILDVLQQKGAPASK